MKEIGGYFGLERFGGKEYNEEWIGVNSARSALLYLLKARHVKKIYIPRFLCDTVSELCRREGYSFEEYPIDASFMPAFEGTLGANEYLYIVNFYGQLSNDAILQFKKKWDRIIIDNVQAFFQAPVSDVDTLYSCRKFFGVPDGGYLSTNATLSEILQEDNSKDRMKHLLGRFEETGSAYYADFQANDERFYELPLRKMSALTRNLLCGIDYEAVRCKRNVNFEVLAKALGAKNPLKLTAPDGPYCYPFYCRNGMDLKKKLAKEKIYVATLWPNVLEYENTLEKDFAENILPLPCDQRYTAEDMERIVDAVLQYSVHDGRQE